MAKKQVRGQFPPELVKWVTSPDAPITEEMEIVLSQILSDRKKRAQVFLTEMSRKHIERIVFLMARFPEVEKEIFTKARLSTMKTGDLIRLLMTLGSQVNEASQFLRMFVTEDELKTEVPMGAVPLGDAEEMTEEEREAVKEIPLKSRQQMSRVLKKVFTVLKEAEKSEKAKELPAPKKKKGG
jgi:hypothetical protein